MLMQKTILIIEDNKDIRENTGEILSLAGFKVLSGENGKIGVELAIAHSPDLIICDIMMPELDGYGVLHILQKNEVTTNIPFIFLTAKAERSDMRKGMELGADDYLTKPFDDTELLNAIEIRLKKNEILSKKFAKSPEGFSSFLSDVKNFDALKEISADRRTKNFKKKQDIYSEGDQSNFLYQINSGKVKTYLMNKEAKELITGLYKEGDFFGYSTLLMDTTHQESAMAMEDTEVTIIPKEDFLALIYKNADVSKKFIKILSNDLKEKEEQLIRLAYNSVRKRVADALLLLRSRYEKKDAVSPFNISISREDLSTLVGTAPETISRTLSDFKEEKIIEIKGSNLTIINPVKLEKMHN